MITKFNCKDNYNSIEFSRESNTVLVCITEFQMGVDNQLDVRLSKENLFSLIGQLLRIQSEIKEGGRDNG